MQSFGQRVGWVEVSLDTHYTGCLYQITVIPDWMPSLIIVRQVPPILLPQQTTLTSLVLIRFSP